MVPTPCINIVYRWIFLKIFLTTDHESLLMQVHIGMEQAECLIV